MRICIFLSLMFIIVSCTKSITNNNELNSSINISESRTIGGLILHKNTKFGCMINGNFDNDKRDSIAESLNVTYVRSSITMTDWIGRSASYESYVKNGLKVILNVNYAYTSLDSSISAPFPKDMVTYRQTFESITNMYQPEVIVVENEEINKTTHSGPITDYLNMLKVALSVCHPKSIKVTNGGIYGPALKILTYRYLQTKGQARADSFSNNCMTKGQVKAAQTINYNPDLEKDVRQMDTLLTFYPNLDYVNIHAYEPFDPDVTDASKVTTATPVVLADFKEYLIWRTGKPVMTNETGQRNNTNPSLVTSMLGKYDQLDFPYAIWFSGEDGKAGAMPLYDLGTGILYPNGAAFALFNFNYGFF